MEESLPDAVLVTKSDVDVEQLQEIIAIGQGINEGGESSKKSRSLKRKRKRSKYTLEERHKIAEWYEETKHKSRLVVQKFKKNFPGRPPPARSTIKNMQEKLLKTAKIYETNQNGDEFSTLHGKTPKNRKILEENSEEISIIEDDGEAMPEENLEIEEDEGEGSFSGSPRPFVNLFSVEERDAIARWYYEFDSVAAVQRQFRSNFAGRPTPTARTIRKCAKKYAALGAVWTRRLREIRRFSRSNAEKRKRILEMRRKNPDLTPDCVAILLNYDPEIVRKVFKNRAAEKIGQKNHKDDRKDPNERDEDFGKKNFAIGEKKKKKKRQRIRSDSANFPSKKFAEDSAANFRRSPRLAEKNLESSPDAEFGFDEKFSQNSGSEPNLESQISRSKIESGRSDEKNSDSNLESLDGGSRSNLTAFGTGRNSNSSLAAPKTGRNSNLSLAAQILKWSAKMAADNADPAPDEGISCRHCEMEFDTRHALYRHQFGCPKAPVRRQQQNLIQQFANCRSQPRSAVRKDSRQRIYDVIIETPEASMAKQEEEEVEPEDVICLATPLIPFETPLIPVDSLQDGAGAGSFYSTLRPHFVSENASFACSHCQMEFPSTVALQRHRAACLTAVGFQLHPPRSPPLTAVGFQFHPPRSPPSILAARDVEGNSLFLEPGFEQMGLQAGPPLKPLDYLASGDAIDGSFDFSFGATACPNCAKAFTSAAALIQHMADCPIMPLDEGSDAIGAAMTESCGAVGAGGASATICEETIVPLSFDFVEEGDDDNKGQQLIPDVDDSDLNRIAAESSEK